MIAYAQESAEGFVETINDAIVFPLMMLMTAVAFFVFLWGAYEFVRGADNDQSREQGKKHMLYGVIGLLIMLSANAILSIATATFGVS